VGDLLQHSQDVREALGQTPIDDDVALAVALDFYLDVFSQAVTAAGAGAVVVRVGSETWTAGEGEVVATLTADRLPLLRAFGGRLGAEEIRALAWTGDADAVLSFVDAYA
jgi:hypothetical protein